LYIREYYSNATTLAASTPITVFLGDVLTDVNASLALGGAITGVVTNVDNAALGQLALRLTPQNRPITESTVIFTNTSASHLTYTFGGLLPDTYLVSVNDLSAVEYYENVSTADRATPIPVVAGQMVRNINFVLGDGADTATMSGTVRGAAAEPLAGIFVNLYCKTPCGTMSTTEEAPALPAGAEPTWNWLRIVLSDQDGHYRVSGLQPGTYRLRFAPDLRDVENRYAFLYYENALDLATATDVVLAPNQVRTGLDITLGSGGTITGVVTLAGEYPLRDSQLIFYFWNGYHWEAVATATTDQLTGAYVRPALQSGRYHVEATGTFGGDPYRYFYGDTDVLTDAVDVNVTTGLTTTAINIDLSDDAFLNAAITGTVTADGEPLPNIQVVLYSYS
ncbi:MAG: hypothetical protein KDE31_38080, partial [Caldilineaceae bacterium]|nr:hypothetical protein [Caldilineaceae bacterium]